MESKIVIFGFGLAGSIMALALAKKNIPSKIIERKTKESCLNPDDPRTTALTKETVDFFAEIDIWEEISKFTTPINNIYVCQNEADELIHLDDKKSSLGYMIENNDFRKKISELVIKNRLVEIEFGVEYEDVIVTNDGIEYKIGNKIFSSELGIVAEGKNSNLKKEFFKNFSIKKHYNQSAVVFNIFHSENHESSAIEHFLQRGTFATLPLKGGNISSVVWVDKTEVAEIIKNFPDEKIEYLVSRYSGNSLGKINLITKPTAWPLTAEITADYFYKKLVLIADSAHFIHPLAGQGLNMGIKDIKSLSNIIFGNKRCGLEISKNSLQKYQTERKFDNLSMFYITDNLNKIFTFNKDIVNLLMKPAFSVINNSKNLKNLFTNYGVGKRNLLAKKNI